MNKTRNVLSFIRKKPENGIIIHYSSESLFDEVEGAFSPRITSIVVLYFANRQTVSFSMHAIAEELGIDRAHVTDSYDQIEKELLQRFFGFAKENFDKTWFHWNMRNAIFGFEHLEHRYRVLFRQEPPIIPRDQRVNISDVLKFKYGTDFAPDPRMTKLMELNGRMDPRFMSGAEESSAFKRQEFIRMNSSTISKVEFFRYVLDLASRGKLKTNGSNLTALIDRALNSVFSRVIALIASFLGVLSGGYWVVSFFW